MTYDFIKSLLFSVGEILKKGFGEISSVQTKHDQSNVVTEYDFQSERHITEIIQKTFPQHNILGEEHGAIMQKSEYTWIIDPLDGTSNFAAQIPWFGVLIALLKNNNPIMAGAYLPMSDELYFAENGHGAFKNDKQIHVSAERELKNLLCAYSLDFSEDLQKTKMEVEIMKNLVRHCRNLRSTNSLVDFCYVAEGKLGAAINQTMKIWDIAAPKLILEEAGAKVTDIAGKSFDFPPTKRSATENYTAIAASPEIHQQIIQNIIK
jgi:myo-inositol-1(or 4)-monophosphatase